MSNSLNRRFPIIGALILIAILAMATVMQPSSSDVLAQPESITLVSNLLEPSNGDIFGSNHLVGNEPHSTTARPTTVSNANRQASVAFSTGGNAHGYQITSVQLDLAKAGNSNGEHPVVEVYDDSNASPSNLVGTLIWQTSYVDLPVSLNGQRQTFIAGSNGIHVDANTTYHVKLSNRGPGDTDVSYFAFVSTASNAQHDGASEQIPGTGWTIADVFKYRIGGSGAWSDEEPHNTIRLAIIGRNAPTVARVLVDTSLATSGIQTGALDVAEGHSITYEVLLATQPSQDVTITPTPGNSSLISVSPADLTFTRRNYSTPQTVTVATRKDLNFETEHTSVSHAVTGYGGVTAGPSVELEITDRDEIGTFRVYDDGSTIVLNEGQSENISFYNKLYPDNPVLVTASITPANANARTEPSSLTLTAGRIDLGKFEVVAERDADPFPSTFTVTLSADEQNGGTRYDLADFASITYLVNDLDALVFGNISANRFQEYVEVVEGETLSYTVRLAAVPSENVTVTLSLPAGAEITLDTDPDVDGDQNILTFTTANWDTTQSVTVIAPLDDDGYDDFGEITHSMQGGEFTGERVWLNYYTDDLIKQQVVTSLPSADDDEYGSELEIGEGAERTFTFNLASQPHPANEDVTVEFVASDEVPLKFKKEPGDTAAKSVGYTFGGDNWSTGQSVIVVADQLAGFDDHEYEFTITADGADYPGVFHDVLVQVTNSDVAGFELEPQELSVVETIQATTTQYSVELLGHPSENVTVTLVSDNNYVEVDADTNTEGVQNTIVFTPEDFNHGRTVQLTVFPDHDGDNATATITHFATGGGYDDTTGAVTVTITDEFECPPLR